MSDREKNKRIVHELKCWPFYFEEVLAGNMTYQLRYNDRNFKVGDIIVLHEFFLKSEREAQRKALTMEFLDGPHPEGNYTGRYVSRTITHIMAGPLFGLADGWVILGLK